METDFLSVTLAYGNQSSRIGTLFKEVTFVMKSVNSIQVGPLPGKLELSIWISRYLQSDMKRIKSIISPWYLCCLWCFVKQLPCSKPCVCPAALRNMCKCLAVTCLSLFRGQGDIRHVCMHWIFFVFISESKDVFIVSYLTKNEICDKWPCGLSIYCRKCLTTSRRKRMWASFRALLAWCSHAGKHMLFLLWFHSIVVPFKVLVLHYRKHLHIEEFLMIKHTFKWDKSVEVSYVLSCC